jgi:hypothetical protein
VENVFEVKRMTFERVNSFVCLGTLITPDNNTSATINNRITLANRSYFGLVNIFKAKNTNRKYKVIIYKILIKPVLM